jgi:hypothetical protein
LAGDYPEQRMRRGSFYQQQIAAPFHVPHFQLPLQVSPFVKQLSAGLGYLPANPPPADFGCVKFITASDRFLMYRREITRQHGGRMG